MKWAWMACAQKLASGFVGKRGGGAATNAAEALLHMLQSLITSPNSAHGDTIARSTRQIIQNLNDLIDLLDARTSMAPPLAHAARGAPERRPWNRKGRKWEDAPLPPNLLIKTARRRGLRRVWQRHVVQNAGNAKECTTAK